MKNGNKLLVIIFGIILCLPVIAMYLGIGKSFVLKENRELAFKPKMGLYEKFPKYFSDYFNDHFGLRNWLIVANRWSRYKLFGVSPNKAVTVGKEEWLFYTPDINYIDSINAQGFTEGELKQIEANFLDIQNKFNKKGIKFYFLVAPNKQSIYPEFLPDYMKKIRPDSRLDQLSSFLEKNGMVNFVNPKKELLEMKKNAPVYLKYDTHWNDLGAFVAYQKLFQKINKDFGTIKSKEMSDFMVTTKESPNNDLAVQMGVIGNFKEKGPNFENKNSKSKIVFENCPDKFIGCPVTVWEVADQRLLKLVMFRDSFGVGIIPFLAEHFQRSYFYWGSIPFSMTEIDQEKPEIVVMELTERELWRLKDKLFEFGNN